MIEPSTGPNEQIIGFYAGARPDDRGRYLQDIQGWPHDQLERVHDFIQWLFPLVDPSPVNPQAPVLDSVTISVFRSRADLQKNLRSSFLRMLQFYGLLLMPGSPPRVERASDFETRSENWLSAGNHNHLRITRIINCLHLLGLEPEALAFFGCLADIYAVESRKPKPAISARTFRFWRSAAEAPQ